MDFFLSKLYYFKIMYLKKTFFKSSIHVVLKLKKAPIVLKSTILMNNSELRQKMGFMCHCDYRLRKR